MQQGLTALSYQHGRGNMGGIRKRLELASVKEIKKNWTQVRFSCKL